MGALIGAAVGTGPAFGLDEPAQGREIEQLGHIAPPRARVAAVNRMLVDRLDHLLPALMRETGIDMWIVINREYAEDPVYLTLVPEPAFAARRTTILVFFDRGDRGGVPGADGEDHRGDEGERDEAGEAGEATGVERLTVSRYGLGGLYEPVWDGGSDDDQWARLAQVIAERNPRRIGIDMSRNWAFGDGLTAALHDRLVEALPAKLRDRLVSAEALCLRWLESRTALELEAYPGIVALARRVIAEAFSNRTITPGVTTTEDVAWYIHERFESLGLAPWFHPDVNVQRRSKVYERDDPFFGLSNVVIERGDVLHTDVGICYLRLCTDTQEMGYVMRFGEDDVPAGLKRALATGNRWQDLLTARFETGRTGNAILAAAQADFEREGLVASTYTHPIGFFGHAAGPTIGMWDNQGPTPVRGDWPLYPSTAYAIEGNIRAQVPEWNDQWVQIKLEQSAVFDGQRVIYLAGRQTKWHVVR